LTQRFAVLREFESRPHRKRRKLLKINGLRLYIFFIICKTPTNFRRKFVTENAIGRL